MCQMQAENVEFIWCYFSILGVIYGKWTIISISYACILIHVSVNVLGNRHQHENECSFIPKPCPNDVENCGTFRSSELDHHLQVCPYFECEHKDKGTLSSDVNMDILYG